MSNFGIGQVTWAAAAAAAVGTSSLTCLLSDLFCLLSSHLTLHFVWNILCTWYPQEFIWGSDGFDRRSAWPFL